MKPLQSEGFGGQYTTQGHALLAGFFNETKFSIFTSIYNKGLHL